MSDLLARLWHRLGGALFSEEAQEPLLSEEQLQQWAIEQEVAEREFATHIAQLARDWAKKSKDDPLEECDFFFDMISTEHVSDDAQKYYGWCMDASHPIAGMMQQTYMDHQFHPQFAPMGALKTGVGSVVVYSDGQVDQCVKDVVLLCQKFGFHVNAAAGTSLPDAPTSLEMKKTD